MSQIPAPFTRSGPGIDTSLEDVCDSLASLKNWTERYRQIFKLADMITPMSSELRLDTNLVEGCESPVWLVHYFDTDEQKHYFVADSDSKIIKGLLFLILSGCNGQTSERISEIELRSLLKQLDLGKYLTPSRTNGLVSVMEKISSFC